MGKAALGIELDNPDVAKYQNYADVLYYSRKNGTISILNPRYKPTDVPATTVPASDLDNNPGSYAKTDWCKSLYQKIASGTDYIYKSADYTTRT